MRSSRLVPLLMALLAISAPALAGSPDPDEGTDPGDGEREDRSGEDEAQQEGKAADDASDAEEDRRNEEEHDGDRRVRLRVDEDEAEFRSENLERDDEDRLDLRYKGREGLLRLALQRPGTDNATPSLAVDLTVQVPHLLEYRDLNGNGRYDLTDLVVQVVDVRAVPLNLSSAHLTGGERLVANYTLPQGGAFLVVTTLTGSPDTREAKVDFEIHRFPYQAPDTALALRADVATTAPGLTASGSGITATAPGHEAYFRWMDKAVVDAITRPVGAASYRIEDGNGTTHHAVYLSYPRGENIVHDPTLGVVAVQSVGEMREAIAGAVAGDWRAYLVAAGVTAAILAVLTVSRPRRQ